MSGRNRDAGPERRPRPGPAPNDAAPREDVESAEGGVPGEDVAPAEGAVPAEDGAGRVPGVPPEPEPDRRAYYPRGWWLALVVLVAMLIWLFVVIFWNPEWWPWFRDV